jgi:peptidoglycan/LPS O-acetylase OafA/YrhL
MSLLREVSPSLSNEPVHALTGLRFIAAFAVFIYHVRTILDPLADKFPLGPVAVSFFFVLSGYILTRVYHDRLAKGPIWGKETRRFLVTRIARLWPLHILCLLFLLKFGHWIHVSGQWHESGSFASLVANIFMVHSWCPIDHWFLGFNSVSWSIATELFFYLCFPLLFAARRRIGLVCLLLLAMTLVIQRSIQQWQLSLCPEWFSAESMFIANPVNFLWQFALGMVVGMPGKRAANRSNAVSSRPGNVFVATVIETIALLAIPAIVYTPLP